MTQSNSLTPRQIDSLKAYKEMPARDRCAIVAAITNLRIMSVSGQMLTPEIVLKKLTATGYLDIALDCYAAELISHQQWS